MNMKYHFDHAELWVPTCRADFNVTSVVSQSASKVVCVVGFISRTKILFSILCILHFVLNCTHLNFHSFLFWKQSWINRSGPSLYVFYFTYILTYEIDIFTSVEIVDTMPSPLLIFHTHFDCVELVFSHRIYIIYHIKRMAIKHHPHCSPKALLSPV